MCSARSNGLAKMLLYPKEMKAFGSWRSCLMTPIIYYYSLLFKPPSFTSPARPYKFQSSKKDHDKWWRDAPTSRRSQDSSWNSKRNHFSLDKGSTKWVFSLARNFSTTNIAHEAIRVRVVEVWCQLANGKFFGYFQTMRCREIYERTS